jgi:hypothetical protein
MMATPPQRLEGETGTEQDQGEQQNRQQGDHVVNLLTWRLPRWPVAVRESQGSGRAGLGERNHQRAYPRPCGWLTQHRFPMPPVRVLGAGLSRCCVTPVSSRRRALWSAVTYAVAQATRAACPKGVRNGRGR